MGCELPDVFCVRNQGTCIQGLVGNVRARIAKNKSKFQIGGEGILAHSSEPSSNLLLESDTGDLRPRRLPRLARCRQEVLTSVCNKEIKLALAREKARRCLCDRAAPLDGINQRIPQLGLLLSAKALQDGRI